MGIFVIHLAFLLTKYIVRFSYYPLEFASSTGLCIVDGIIYSYSCAFVMVRRKELIDRNSVVQNSNSKEKISRLVVA